MKIINTKDSKTLGGNIKILATCSYILLKNGLKIYRNENSELRTMTTVFYPNYAVI